LPINAGCEFNRFLAAIKRAFVDSTALVGLPDETRLTLIIRDEK